MCTIMIKRCPSSVVSPSLTFHNFDFSSETVERDPPKLDTKQDSTSSAKFFFRADWKTKMVSLTSDWQRRFLTSPLKLLNGIEQNLTESKILTSFTNFVFLGLIGKSR